MVAPILHVLSFAANACSLASSAEACEVLRDEIESPVVSTPGFTLCMDLVPGIVFSMFAVTVLLLGFNDVAVPLDVQQRADGLTAELSSKASQDFSHLQEHPLIAGLPAGTTSRNFMWADRWGEATLTPRRCPGGCLGVSRKFVVLKLFFSHLGCTRGRCWWAVCRPLILSWPD